MTRRSGRIAILLTLALLLSAKGCHPIEEANEIDHERIEIMRTDPVYHHQLSGGLAYEGQGDHHGYAPNSYSARLDPWRSEPPPDKPTGAQAREQIQAVLDDLRDGGWTVAAATCRLWGRVDGRATSSPRVELSYDWGASGYRTQDGVPYAFALDASHSEDIPFGDAVARDPSTHLSIRMSAPFHADPDTDAYLESPPEPLAAGETCIERGEPEPPTDIDPYEFDGIDETVQDGPGGFRLQRPTGNHQED
jgi:hypothetical protein